jgi:hypothetical protein
MEITLRVLEGLRRRWGGLLLNQKIRSAENFGVTCLAAALLSTV